WFAMVKRFSGSGSFSMTGTDIVIPVLDNLVPQLGGVQAGQFTYWKVVVPEGTVHMSVAIIGDPLLAGCTALAGLGDLCHPADTAELYACATSAFACPLVQQGTDAACGAVACAVGSDADLYVRHAAGLPTLLTHDCAAVSLGVLDTCTFNIAVADLPAPPVPVPALQVSPFLGAGKYFVGVRGVSAAQFAIVAVVLPPALPVLPALPVAASPVGAPATAA
ncbi:MAG: hypothetical protein LC624_12590, partial [Halobacteriales archaeon]|nr:hypothetical protein [Halobacteriales archaeon]